MLFAVFVLKNCYYIVNTVKTVLFYRNNLSGKQRRKHDFMHDDRRFLRFGIHLSAGKDVALFNGKMNFPLLFLVKDGG